MDFNMGYFIHKNHMQINGCEFFSKHIDQGLVLENLNLNIKMDFAF
jgi:hypothetical protein